jgi:hypothetical protein
MYSISKIKIMKSTLFQPTFAGNYDVHYRNSEAEEVIQQMHGIKKFSRRKSRRNLLMLLIVYYGLICYFIFMM